VNASSENTFITTQEASIDKIEAEFRMNLTEKKLSY
jgi:hypothetical protein